MLVLEKFQKDLVDEMLQNDLIHENEWKGKMQDLEDELHHGLNEDKLLYLEECQN